MSLIKVVVTCDWPGCNANANIDWKSGEQAGFQWDKWRAIGNEIHGPHMCPEHNKKTVVELHSTRDRIKDARKWALEMVKKIKESMIPEAVKEMPILMTGGRASYLVMFPGCEKVWDDIVREFKNQEQAK